MELPKGEKADMLHSFASAGTGTVIHKPHKETFPDSPAWGLY